MSVLYAQAAVTAITDIQDFLANQGAEYRDKWTAEVKFYRPLHKEIPAKSLFTVWQSQAPQSMYVFTDKTEAATELPLRDILESQLQRMWAPRQAFKGTGYVYECADGGQIRIANVWVQGGYKGVLLDAQTFGHRETADVVSAVAREFQLGEPPASAETEIAKARLYSVVYR